MADTEEQLPVPHRDPDRVDTNYDPRNRKVAHRWILETPRPGVTIQCVLTVFHRRGGYWATLRNSTVDATGALECEKFWGSLLNTFVLCRTDASRFTKSGFKSACDSALALLRERAAEPEVAEFFTPHNNRRPS